MDWWAISGGYRCAQSPANFWHRFAVTADRVGPKTGKILIPPCPCLLEGKTTRYLVAYKSKSFERPMFLKNYGAFEVVLKI